jgi:hypothetical protein
VAITQCVYTRRKVHEVLHCGSAIT